MSKVKCIQCDNLISEGDGSLCPDCATHQTNINFFHSIMLRLIEDGVVISTTNGNNVRKVVDNFREKIYKGDTK
tara:strand:+ start:1150 stop:1371 length:222 start_codon:yes stop_codon:yes gene_type:complete